MNTPEELLNQGTEEEESGERFTLSDLSKSLRSYQRAYEYYIKASSGSNGRTLLDSRYNACRLVYHVYNQFFKDGVVDISLDLKSVSNVLSSPYLIVQTVPEILLLHEQVIESYDSMGFSKDVYFPWDLWYNTCLVYTELIEDSDDEDVSFERFQYYYTRAISLFEDILEYQVRKLREDVSHDEESHDEESHDEGEHHHEVEEEDQEMEYEAESSIVPSTILETIAAAYLLVQSVFESANLNDKYKHESLVPLLNGFSSKLEMIANSLLEEFSDSPDEYYQLDENELHNYHIARISIQGLQAQSLQSLTDIWLSQLPSINIILPETYLMIADNFQNFLVRTVLNTEEQWKTLSTISSYYKKSQDAYAEKLKLTQQKALKDPNNSVDISPIVGQLGSILMNRADIEIIRTSSKFDYKNLKQTLMKNRNVFLKNALNYLNFNCGLRETFFDRLNRRKLRYQVAIRQYSLGLIENIKASNENEQRLIKAEMNEFKELDVYKYIQ